MSTQAKQGKRARKVALLSPHLTKIGERDAIPRLAAALAERGFSVDLLTAWREWDHLQGQARPAGVSIVPLHTRRVVPFIPDISRLSSWAAYRVWAAMVGAGMAPGLIRYLRRQQPDAIVARMLTTPALAAKLLSRSPAKMVLSMAGFPRESAMRKFVWPRLYPRADAYVTPASEVARQASALSGVPGSAFRVIPNPVIDAEVLAKADQPLSHPWLGRSRTDPVILAVGRLTRQKDYPTLLRAFAAANSKVPCRLLVLGEGELRPELERLAAELGVSKRMRLHGYEANPYRYMRAADLYVMSSAWEGPGHSLVEAVSLGVPSITTDCPAGPRDTVMNGEAGLITPVGDHAAMGEAMVKLLSDSGLQQRLARNGANHAKRYMPGVVGAEWADLLDNLLG